MTTLSLRFLSEIQIGVLRGLGRRNIVSWTFFLQKILQQKFLWQLLRIQGCDNYRGRGGLAPDDSSTKWSKRCQQMAANGKVNSSWSNANQPSRISQIGYASSLQETVILMSTIWGIGLGSITL